MTIRMPTDEEDAIITAAANADPDAAEVTEDQFRTARRGPPWAATGSVKAADHVRAAIAALQADNGTADAATAPALENLRAALRSLDAVDS